MSTKVAVVGASGRLGQLICRLVDGSDDFELVARLGSGSDLAEMLVADVVVDVTVPGVSASIVDFAIEHNLKVLVGTSGWSADRITSLRTRVAEHPESGVVIIPNFSLGSMLATRFAVLAARFFDSMEIVETHHASKVDSPSGTAVRTAELMQLARADRGPVAAPHADQRARGQKVSSIPIHSLRLAGVAARQDVVLAGDGELLTISHETLSSNSYEAGIVIGLRAAVTVTGVAVGLDALIDLEPRATHQAGAPNAGTAANGHPA